MAAGCVRTNIPRKALLMTAVLLAVFPALTSTTAAEGLSPKAAAGTAPGEEDRRPGPEDIFAREFTVGRSTAELYAVFGSTSPEREAAGYLRRGIYRGELLTLYDIAIRSGTAMKALVQEREKGVPLRVIAADKKADLMAIFRASEAAQREIEARTAEAEKAAARAAADASTSAVRGAGAGVSISTGGVHAP